MKKYIVIIFILITSNIGYSQETRIGTSLGFPGPANYLYTDLFIELALQNIIWIKPNAALCTPIFSSKYKCNLFKYGADISAVPFPNTIPLYFGIGFGLYINDSENRNKWFLLKKPEGSGIAVFRGEMDYVWGQHAYIGTIIKTMESAKVFAEIKYVKLNTEQLVYTIEFSPNRNDINYIKEKLNFNHISVVIGIRFIL